MGLVDDEAGRAGDQPPPEESLRHPDGTPVTVAECLVASGLCKSKNEARRLIEQGGAYILSGDEETMRAVLAAVPVTGTIEVRPRAKPSHA